MYPAFFGIAEKPFAITPDPRYLYLGARHAEALAHLVYGITEAGPGRLPLEPGQQYRFTFDMGACIGCHTCEVACAEQNGLPPEVSWRRVGEVEGGSFPTTKRFHLSLACNHCLEPACLERPFQGAANDERRCDVVLPAVLARVE